jgi:hypothetical protein
MPSVTNDSDVIDIRYNASGVASELSNFTQRAFLFKGVWCASIEGVLQAIKSPNLAVQEKRCLLYGVQAKRAGKGSSDWKDSQTLFWKQTAMGRASKEYGTFLTELYDAVFEQCLSFRSALTATGTQHLLHSIGRGKNPSQTVLTEDEFIAQLVRLRSGEQRR